MSAGELLTTLAHVKEWLGITNDDDDVLLTRLIRGASAFILNQLNREQLSLGVYSEFYDGHGNSFMVLRYGPVYILDALSFNGTPISAATGDGISSPFLNGWVLEGNYMPLASSRRVNLFGWVFPRARGAVYVSYQAGFVVVDEAHTVPGTPYQVTPTGTWLGNVSVKLADGTVLTEVASSPATGQYSVSSDGVYTFNAAQTAAGVLITYSYVPPDLEQACFELVGERYKIKDRIGYVSKSLGGGVSETVTFSQASMSAYVKDLLMPYRQVVPA